MNEKEKYLFDLNGYLVIPNALTQQQIKALNAEVDRRIKTECEPDMRTHRFASPLGWNNEYRNLIDNKSITPYLKELLGESFRLDHEYLDVIRSGKGPIGTRLHGGATPYRSSEYFHFSNEKMHNGLSVVAYNLKDVEPMDGGFGCVPGSHKSNYAFPEDWKEMEELEPIVKRVTGPAGTAVIFTEALTHGTLPWAGSDERRTIFFKYSPGPISWSAKYYDLDNYSNLSEAQKVILEGPNARYRGRDTNPAGY